MIDRLMIDRAFGAGLMIDKDTMPPALSEFAIVWQHSDRNPMFFVRNPGQPLVTQHSRVKNPPVETCILTRGRGKDYEFQ